ncbi:hypothetical protein CRG98_012095 [Punica granatum]|uniref:Uncharacterized protein n=1 Tax=Punica granatum TaxID=22663 RepID=A0A2I0KG87_PUNGR|nr:hypothetical protein CRG98_012095 [Punica granatum]
MGQEALGLFSQKIVERFPNREKHKNSGNDLSRGGGGHSWLQMTKKALGHLSWRQGREREVCFNGRAVERLGRTIVCSGGRAFEAYGRVSGVRERASGAYEHASEAYGLASKARERHLRARDGFKTMS